MSRPENKFGVAPVFGSVAITKALICPTLISVDDALNLAAHLVAAVAEATPEAESAGVTIRFGNLLNRLVIGGAS